MSDTTQAHGLYRSRQRLLAGVLGGIAERFNTSARRLRVLYFILSVVSLFVPTFLGYFILWLIMPARPMPSSQYV